MPRKRAAPHSEVTRAIVLEDSPCCEVPHLNCGPVIRNREPVHAHRVALGVHPAVAEALGECHRRREVRRGVARSSAKRAVEVFRENPCGDRATQNWIQRPMSLLIHVVRTPVKSD